MKIFITNDFIYEIISTNGANILVKGLINTGQDETEMESDIDYIIGDRIRFNDTLFKCIETQSVGILTPAADVMDAYFVYKKCKVNGVKVEKGSLLLCIKRTGAADLNNYKEVMNSSWVILMDGFISALPRFYDDYIKQYCEQVEKCCEKEIIDMILRKNKSKSQEKEEVSEELNNFLAGFKVVPDEEIKPKRVFKSMDNEITKAKKDKNSKEESCDGSFHSTTFDEFEELLSELGVEPATLDISRCQDGQLTIDEELLSEPGIGTGYDIKIKTINALNYWG